MDNEKKYIGIDVGGTYIKMGLVDGAGEVSMHRELPVARDPEGRRVMDIMMQGVDDLLGEAGLSAQDLRGIGVSAAGCIDSVKGSVAGNGGNVPDWSRTEVTKPLEERFGIPAALANDGNCAVLGEAWIGAACGCSDVVCVTLGTGVGGGIISGGRLIEGRHGYAGEIGHFPTHAEAGSKHPGDRSSHFETYASTAALVRSAVKADPSWDSGKPLFKAAEAGDERALSVIDSWMDEVAYGLAGFIHTFDPQMILIGGGVSVQEDLFIKPLRDKVVRIIEPDFADGLEIRSAALGNDAGLVGAVRYLMTVLGEK